MPAFYDSSYNSRETVEVLVVDDDSVDVEAIQRAFRKAEFPNPLHVVSDGIAALARLRGEDGEPPIQRPYVILLDLNMPRMCGIEFLDEIRKDPELGDSVVFVVTTSDDARDKQAAYQRHVAGYVVKSKTGDDFARLIAMLDAYWRLVEMPPAEPRVVSK